MRAVIVAMSIAAAGAAISLTAKQTPTATPAGVPDGVATAVVAANTANAATPAASANASITSTQYVLKASLDPVNRLVLGSGRLLWRNAGTAPATELRFHLHWNAWRDSSSSWMREQAIAGRADLLVRTDEARGSIDITTMTRQAPGGAVDLLPRARFESPDDGNADDRTVMVVPLDRAVAPGESVELTLGWNAHVPQMTDGIGAAAAYFLIARWYPQVGVFDERGWTAHQAHATGGTFADRSQFDVELTYPAGWAIGATGKAVALSAAATGTATGRFVARDVDDFAWTTSPALVEVVQEARAATASAPARSGVRLLLHPANRDQASRYFDAVDVAVRTYSEMCGCGRPGGARADQADESGGLTIVAPPFDLETTSSMSVGAMQRHPGLLVVPTRWKSPWKLPQPETGTIAAVGEELLRRSLTVDDAVDGWLLHGLNTYLAARAQSASYDGRYFAIGERYFGGFVPWTFEDVLWTRDQQGNGFGRYQQRPSDDLPSIDTWRLAPASMPAIRDAKTALWLTALERLLGWPTMQEILRTFVREQRSVRRTTPAAFVTTASAVSGRDLTWFINAVYTSAARFDYAVSTVSTQPTVAGSFDTTVAVERRGDGVFPVDVRVSFEDGATVTERWDGRDPRHVFHYRRASRVVTVHVDPDRILTLDVDAVNNSWTATPRADDASRRWATRWLAWFENLLLTYAFFA